MTLCYEAANQWLFDPGPADCQFVLAKLFIVFHSTFLQIPKNVEIVEDNIRGGHG